MTKQVDVIKSISHDQTEIINNILKLHVPSGVIDCDPTYSIGNFYKNTGIEAPKYKFDIKPQAEGVVEASATDLPLASNSINSILFDPPFLIAYSQNLKEADASIKDKENRSNVIHQRFSSYESPEKLFGFYKDALLEGHRILKDGGVFIFKCQDTVSSSINYFSHLYVMNIAIQMGFYCKDLFVLLAKSRIISGKHHTQVHARKYHSYFIVFEKLSEKSRSNKKGKINYFN